MTTDLSLSKLLLCATDKVGAIGLAYYYEHSKLEERRTILGKSGALLIFKYMRSSEDVPTCMALPEPV
ncbi:hypothetical protein CGCF413_v002102 [Colletotrichum fructicola]|nr:hypothetical protein CGCF413_v002102 [Colletotrichum fructicola]